MNAFSRIARIAAGVLLVITMTFLSLLPVHADQVQGISTEEVSRFNIMLVIDGSGSLVMHNGATDPQGVRYDAIDLFLALLPNRGNNVGAIVFDDNSDGYLLKTDLRELNGKQDKIKLSSEIRDAGTGGDTDIGTALKDAVQILSAQADQSGKQSVVILFSDGRTDLGNDQEAYNRSLENKETAIVAAQEAGIPIMTICLHANDVANPAELEEIATRTSGHAVEVASSDDLGYAFEEFYSMIFRTSSSERTDISFPDSGSLTYDIDVPAYGAEEVNIILNGESVHNIELTSPTGTLSTSQVDDMLMTGGSYKVVKLSNPEAGTWHVSVQGDPGSTATVNVVYNIDTSAGLQTVDGRSDYNEGEPVQLIASLSRNGEVVSDSAVTGDYKAEITITDLGSGNKNTYPMQPDQGGRFIYTLEQGGYSSYEAEAHLFCTSLDLYTGKVRLNFGNTAPREVSGLSDKDYLIKAVVTPLTGRSKSVDVAKYFTDDQDGTLKYTIESSQLVADTAELDGSTLKINTAKSKSGDIVIRATDSQGAYAETTFRVKTTNLTLPIFLAIVLGILAAILIPLIIAFVNRPQFQGNIKVVNLQTMMEGLPVGAFRGSVPLSKFGVGFCGFDPKTTKFTAVRHGGVQFQAKKKFYVDGMEMTSYELMYGRNKIYADENNTLGIEVEVQSTDYMY